MTKKRWYLVYCKPRQEDVAQTNLQRQGYETYLPRLRHTLRKQGRRVTVVGPMFPRYLFIHLDDKTDNWAPIRSTLGVVSLVRFGHEPAKVPDTLLKLLAAREGSDGVHEVVTEEFRPGSKVRLTAGGFAGYEGIFKAKTGRERVVVLLDVLGREARTIVDLDSLEPV